MPSCSAPGKVILFGEHAVVFGKPALALAVDMRITSSVRVSSDFAVNGHRMNKRYHSYISSALDEAWGGPPISVETSSKIPSGSGLGSSAAVTVSCVGAILAAKGQFDPETIARKSFEVEFRVQGVASPTDTSTSSHGHGVIVSPDRMDGHLWSIEKAGRVWNIHHCAVPELTFVVGYTGIHAATGPLVEKVRRLVESDNDARIAVDRIGEIVAEGVEAVGSADKLRMGRLMDENHELLNALGVGHESLESFVSLARPHSYGAKLTGAGGGGSMIALTDEPDEVASAIRGAGGKPFTVSVGCEGVRIESEPCAPGVSRGKDKSRRQRLRGGE
jgi:mevalonate kinase